MTNFNLFDTCYIDHKSNDNETNERIDDVDLDNNYTIEKETDQFGNMNVMDNDTNWTSIALKVNNIGSLEYKCFFFNFVLAVRRTNFITKIHSIIYYHGSQRTVNNIQRYEI